MTDDERSRLDFNVHRLDPETTIAVDVKLDPAPVCDACLVLESWKRIALLGGSLAFLRCPPHRDGCPYQTERGRKAAARKLNP